MDKSAPYKLTYFDDPLSAESAEKCAASARTYTEDIMALVFRNSTQHDEVASVLYQMSHVFVQEMAELRNAETYLSAEIEAATVLVESLETELAALDDLIRREGLRLAQEYSGQLNGMNGGMEFTGIDIGVIAQHIASLDADDADDTPKKIRAITPPSGRSTPLLRISSEAVTMPPRPRSISFVYPLGETPQERGPMITHTNGFHPDDPIPPFGATTCSVAATPDARKRLKKSSSAYSKHAPKFKRSAFSDRKAYQLELKRHIGSVKHRIHALTQMERICNLDELVNVTRADIQLAILYCIYTSRPVRRFVCMKRNEMRAPEWAPLHPSKVEVFMSTLNILTERYDLGTINSQTYLYSMKHVHTFNFTMLYTDDEIRTLSRGCTVGSNRPPQVSLTTSSMGNK